MKKRIHHILAIAAATAILAAAGGADASRTQLITGYDPGDNESHGARGSRTYFTATTASEDEARAFRDRLMAAGARSVNWFLPDNVIVCELPASNDLRELLTTPGFARMDEKSVGPNTVAGATSRSINWIRESYRLAEEIVANPASAIGATGREDDFRDLVLTISPQRAEEIQREIEAGKDLPSRAKAPKPDIARSVQQNSEILTGKILTNFIYPESNGQFDPESESWTDPDIVAAIQGATAGMLAWAGTWAGMDMNFTFQHYERMDTGYEPIQHNNNTDELWIVDTIHRMYAPVAHIDDAQGALHQFNEDQRALRGTDWVITSFIASSRNEPGHRFRNAGYTAYAFLGGPYMVEPYPAGGDPNNIGDLLVYSQIVQHECGHLFWTLDEYPGAPGVCASTSGYLAYSNANITMRDPNGLEARCIELVPCIMHVAARQDLGRPWCKWSEGQLGVIDDNGNAIPDIFESPPEIVFEVEGPETVLTSQFTINLEGRSIPIPNRNPAQAPASRVDYGVALKSGTFSLSGSISSFPLLPLDGAWDEMEEQFSIELQLLPIGLTSIEFIVRNKAGYLSDKYTKEIYFIGVNYSQLTAKPAQDHVELTWDVVGGDFGATYSVYRLDPGEEKPGTMVASDVPPSGPSQSGFTPYKFVDATIDPGSDYQYYVEGFFTLEIGSESRDYYALSNTVAQTAMIPIARGSLISEAAPNPFRDEVKISLSIPETFVDVDIGGTGGGASTSSSFTQRVATPVEVMIFDVVGRRVKTLYSQSEFTEILTVRWDGTNENNQSVPSGVYFVRVKAGEDFAVRKILLVR